MKCKKLAVLIMAGVLAVSALVGCSGGGSEKGSADDYPSKDISVIIPKAAGQMSGYTGRLRSNLCSDCCAGGIDCTGRFSI